ncbi:LOG family protein, partial [Salmonella enterica]|uniref:LOG family protein n=1 Tax=Salmonella enterica TaxID=28901 RepID=UPI0015C855DE
LREGGKVIGVIPKDLMDRELGHIGVTQLRVTQSMHERKATMEEYAEGFIALPGGFGTLDEFLEILTWAQLGIHTKPCAFLDTEGGY